MNKINVLPAIDLIDGNVVRLHQGNYDSVFRYQLTPKEAALNLLNKGFPFIHVVDLDGAKAGKPVNIASIKAILSTGARLQVGGGIRTVEAVETYLSLGVERVIIGTAAINNTEFWRELTDTYSKEQLVLSLDVKGEYVATHGWEESAQTTIDEVISKMGLDRLHHLIVTDISKDGTLSGPNGALYKRLKEKYPMLNIIPAGGVTTLGNLHELEEVGIKEAIMGRVIYEKPELFQEVTAHMIKNRIDWEKVDGLVPAIIQSSQDHTVLMLGYMNEEALQTTIQSNKVTFYSRTRQAQWTKGETSGNTLMVEKMSVDCDGDTLLIVANPQGPTCHRGTTSCFSNIERTPLDLPFIAHMIDVINKRFEGDDPSSYVYHLAQRGKSRIAQKVGEEGVEVALASVSEDRENIIEETSDLLFHMLVNLRYHQIDFQEILSCLKERHVRRSQENESNK